MGRGGEADAHVGQRVRGKCLRDRSRPVHCGIGEGMSLPGWRPPWAERRLGPKCKRPLKSGLDQTGKTGAMVLGRRLSSPANASIGHNSLELAGSIAKRLQRNRRWALAISPEVVWRGYFNADRNRRPVPTFVNLGGQGYRWSSEITSWSAIRPTHQAPNAGQREHTPAARGFRAPIHLPPALQRGVCKLSVPRVLPRREAHRWSRRPIDARGGVSGASGPSRRAAPQFTSLPA